MQSYTFNASSLAGQRTLRKHSVVRCAIAACISACCAFTPSGSRAESVAQDFPAVRDRIAAYYDRLENARFTIESKTFVAGKKSRKLTEIEHVEAVLDLSNHSIHDTYTRYSVRDKGRKIDGQERVYTPKNYMVVSIEPTDQEGVAVHSTLKINDNKRHQYISEIFYTAAVGYLPIATANRVVDLLNQAVEYRISEHSASKIVIVGENDLVSVAIAVNPSYDFMPTSIAVSEFSERQKFSSYSYSVKEAKQYGGVWFPQSLEIRYSSGDDLQEEETIERHIKLLIFQTPT